MDDCDRYEDSDKRQRCRNRCFSSMSGRNPGSFNKEEATASMYGSGNFQMSRCMADCDRREDSDDRQMCRNRCFNSMSGSYPGSYNKEEAIARSYGSGNFQMSRCMDDCDRREDSEDRQMCRNRCFKSMSGGNPGSFNKEEATASEYGSGHFDMTNCMENCGRYEDSDKRQRCRNRCFSSMSGRHPGSFNKEEATASMYGSGNFQMSRCMDDCDS